MYREIKDIDPDKLPDSEVRPVLVLVLNVLERVLSVLDEANKKVEILEDEIRRLKGGNSRPQIKGKAKQSGNISSGGKELGLKEEGASEKEDKSLIVEIDEEIKVRIDKSQLPPDAVFKGYSPYTQQDIEIKRRNRLFLFETWYSPSLGETFQAPWPEGEVRGHYGPGIRSLLNVLRHMSDVTEPSAYNLMKSLGIEISVGTISNLLKEELGWALEEQEAILRAGLRDSTPKQMDTTANRQKGGNKMTHIITNANFTAFYTTDTRSRLDCLRVLQGNPKEGILLLWYEGIETALIDAKLKASHPEKLKKVMKNMPCLTIPEFDALMNKEAPEIFKHKFVMRAIREEMALAYYKKQQKFLPLKLLLTDNAAEYQKIAQYHALCWVHDARHYNMLSPRMARHLKKLEDFKKRYWEFYRKILDYTRRKVEDQQDLKTKLLSEFDALFVPCTQYEALDKTIEGTLATKRKLLLVLDFPDIPLHNNAAELAARRVVRKRDISLHTWSDWGTQLRDAFLSIIQTALKLKVSPYQFICDRICGRLQMDSLATLIDRKHLATRTF